MRSLFLLSIFFVAQQVSAMTIDGFEAFIQNKGEKEVLVSIKITKDFDKNMAIYDHKNMLVTRINNDELLLNIKNEDLPTMQDSLLSQSEIITSWRKSLLLNYNIPEQTKTSKIVKVALIDTGFYRKDMIIPNFVLTQSSEENDHGTHVGGIILAVNPFIQLFSYDVAEKIDGALTIQNTINAINDAIEKKVDIINLSWGGKTFSQKELEAYKKAQDAGIVIVVAAGNNGIELNATNCIEFPACYKKDLNNIITVGNIISKNEINQSSNFGPLVDHYFYGSMIKSLGIQTNFSFHSGTSMSAPFVTGLISQIIMNSPDKLTIQEIKTKLNKNSILSNTYQAKRKINIVETEPQPIIKKELQLQDLQYIPLNLDRINSNIN